MKKQQQLIIALIAVAVVLVAVIVILAVHPSSSSTTNTTTANPASTTATSSASADMTGKTEAGTTTTNFDAKTATKVPAGQTPVQFVDGYCKAVSAGKYQDAYNYLPQATKEGQSAADFASQLQSYGLTSCTVGQSSTSGNTMTVQNQEVAGTYGTFTSIWTFVKQGNAWLLQSKAVAGMQ